VAQSARQRAERRAALPRHGALRTGRRRQHAGADLEHARRRGHCGSGAQISWLATGGPTKLPKDTGALLVHAINPYGFAWTRRVNEDNVDLNRNFVDHDKAYPKNEGYLAIADAVLPKQWTEASKAETQRVFDAYAQKHGAYGLQGAISSGQYTHPDGIFSAAPGRPGAIAPSAPSPARNSAMPTRSGSSTSTPGSARSAMAS
jgi:Protein of unknown function (DUF2817).